MKELINEWWGILAWILLVAATKITNVNKTKKQTVPEMISEILLCLFGGMITYLSIRSMKDFTYKWLVITAGSVGGADILKFMGLGVRGILKSSVKKIQEKVDRIDFPPNEGAS
jgi:hypothetical protein